MQQQPITEEDFQKRIEPALRLFLSVDLENSTKLKQTPGCKGETWLTAVLLFAREFPQLFQKELENHVRSAQTGPLPEMPTQDPAPVPKVPPVWKMLGDELIFVQQLKQLQDAHTYLQAFRSALIQWNVAVTHGNERGTLYVKGAAWLAGFPIANAVIDAGDGKKDYVGPSIDAGFRVGRLATRMRLAVSVDLAWLLLHAGSSLRLHFDGPVMLKGLAEQSGYPHLWLEVGDSAYVKAERRMLGFGAQTSPMDMKKLCELFIQEFGVPRHVPFLRNDPALSQEPEGYETRRQEHVEFLRREIYVLDGPGPEHGPGVGTHTGTGGDLDGMEDPDEWLALEPSPSPDELLEGRGWEEEEEEDDEDEDEKEDDEEDEDEEDEDEKEEDEEDEE